MIEQLFPLPGSKSASKYDAILYAPLDCHTICEGFQGSAARSLLYSDLLSVILGEINPAQRAIALALQSPQPYVDGYNEARDRFWSGLIGHQEKVLSFAGVEKSKSAVVEAMPDVCEGLTQNWRSLLSDIYQLMSHDPTNPLLPGYYAFAIRAAFGNVMRLTPSGTRFNVSWHVDKLYQACVYDPQQWVDELAAMRWNPTVLNCWEEAIEAATAPDKTFLLLDPPYLCDHVTEKMSPCYAFHEIGTEARAEVTFKLAIDSLKAGLERGFKAIAVCNYYVPKLDEAVQELATAAGYSCQPTLMGECNALGNSNGRRKHGNRVDGRSRPIEVIYRIERKPSRIFAVGAVQKSEQLVLI